MDQVVLAVIMVQVTEVLVESHRTVHQEWWIVEVHPMVQEVGEAALVERAAVAVVEAAGLVEFLVEILTLFPHQLSIITMGFQITALHTLTTISILGTCIRIKQSMATCQMVSIIS